MLYSKQISTGMVIGSNSHATEESMLADATSGGIPASDIEVGDKTEDEIKVMSDAYADTLVEGGRPMINWKNTMFNSDSSMPRYLEDLITTNSLTMTPEMKVRYDAKIKIRGERP